MNLSSGALGIVAAAYGVAACVIGRNALVMRRREGLHEQTWLADAWRAAIGVLRHGIKISRRDPPADKVSGRPIWFAVEGLLLLVAASASAWLAFASSDGVSALEGNLGRLLGLLFPVIAFWIGLETFSVHKHSRPKVRPTVEDLDEVQRHPLTSDAAPTIDEGDVYIEAMRKLDEKMTKGPRSKEDVERTLRDWDVRQAERWRD